MQTSVVRITIHLIFFVERPVVRIGLIFALYGSAYHWLIKFNREMKGFRTVFDRYGGQHKKSWTPRLLAKISDKTLDTDLGSPSENRVRACPVLTSVPIGFYSNRLSDFFAGFPMPIRLYTRAHNLPRF